MELNQQQVRNWLQVTTAAGGPLAALILSKTGITEGEYTLYVSLALAILPGAIVVVWGWFSNRMVTQVKEVSQTEGVQVHVDTEAASTPKDIVALAQSPAPDVFPMVGGPRQPSDHDNP